MITFECKPFNELTLQELYDLLGIRQAVFCVEQDCPYLDTDGKDQPSWHLMGFDESRKLIAYARLLPKGVAYSEYVSIGRVVTSQSVRGKGVGKRLMVVCLEWAEQLFEGEPIKISAQCYLTRFYEEFGFVTVGEPYDEDGIPHISMVKIKEATAEKK